MRGCCELGVVQVRKLESDLAAVHEREAEAQTSEPAGNAETAVKAKQLKDAQQQLKHANANLEGYLTECIKVLSFSGVLCPGY